METNYVFEFSWQTEASLLFSHPSTSVYTSQVSYHNWKLKSSHAWDRIQGLNVKSFPEKMTASLKSNEISEKHEFFYILGLTV